MTTSHGLINALVVAGTDSLVAGLARRSPVPESMVLVGAGVALSSLPGIPQIVLVNWRHRSLSYPKFVSRRDDKKIEMRERLATTAASLFAARGYDQVVVLDVARAAGVSEQTVYNYFPAKQDLVLDRAEEFERWYASLIRSRPTGTSPATAVGPSLLQDISWIEHGDPALARGMFVAQCLLSPSLRRFALEFRERQAATIADALQQTDPHVPALTARVHGAALVALAQAVTDGVGAYVIAATTESVPPSPRTAARQLGASVRAALDDLDRTFLQISTPGANP